MGIDVAFFAAADDQAALEAERRVGGPVGWATVTGQHKTGFLRREPVITELGPAYEGFVARGYDPVVNMGTLEELLTGQDYDAITENPRSGGFPGSEDDASDDHGVITLTDSLRDALSMADEPKLASVVQPWSQTEELQELGSDAAALEEHLEFLRALRALAVSARADGHRLYCYFAL